MTKKEATKKAVEDTALHAVGAYIEKHGFSALVISADRIQGPIDQAHNYEIVFRFTGGPKRQIAAMKRKAAKCQFLSRPLS